MHLLTVYHQNTLYKNEIALICDFSTSNDFEELSSDEENKDLNINSEQLLQV